MKPWQLALAAFCGGACLSLSELMGMLSRKETVDLFFFGGMFIAGLIGIGGFFAAGASNIRTAFVAGVSAPQLLGGIAKAVPAGAKALSMIVAGSVAFAQPPQVAVKDSGSVVFLVKGADSLQISFSGKTYTVGDSSQLTLPARDTITVSGVTVKETTFIPDPGKQIVRIEVKTTLTAMFMRGLFAQQAASEKSAATITVEAVR